MNPLNDYPDFRKKAYLFQFIVAGLILLVAIGYGAAGADLPVWYVVTAAVANGLWSYLGLTASQNVEQAPPAHRDEVGQSSLILILAVVAVVLIVLLLVGGLNIR